MMLCIPAIVHSSACCCCKGRGAIHDVDFIPHLTPPPPSSSLTSLLYACIHLSQLSFAPAITPTWTYICTWVVWMAEMAQGGGGRSAPSRLLSFAPPLPPLLCIRTVSYASVYPAVERPIHVYRSPRVCCRLKVGRMAISP